MEQTWQIFSNYLWFVSKAYNIRVHSFVLMNNHFHLLIDTPDANIDEAMNYLLREVSKAIGRDSGRINQIFGGPYYWSVIKNSIYYQHAYKYIYRNPVDAGLCNRVEDYPYSSLRGLLGLDRTVIPAIDDLCLVQDPYRQLDWLNKTFQEEDRVAIGKALRHREFQFSREGSSNKLHRLENRII
jgi:REP element-mobilizing transposase RayT